MKVLQQLIQHFWQRGVLSVEQAHYLVESGFIRPGDLEDYEPRPEEEPDAAAGRELSSELLQPDELEQTEEELIARPVRRKGGRVVPKGPELRPEDLAEQVRVALAARSASLPALAELAGRHQPCPDPFEATVLLRQVEEAAFSAALAEAVRSRPGLLAELWECVDPEPFHVIVGSGARGRVVGAFQVILRASAPDEWSRAAWLLQLPEVQTVTNLLAVRRRLLPALVWLYDQHWAALARCLQRPARRLRSWRPLGYGLALLYNARARRAGQLAPGYPLYKQLALGDWHEAWTVAMAFDAAAVTPYFLHLFGSLRALDPSEFFDLSGGEEVDLLCPPQWRI